MRLLTGMPYCCKSCSFFKFVHFHLMTNAIIVRFYAFADPGGGAV